MYVITFYSFKGGVGRTMSMVNVASQLANSGKKVLIVDFDLEAPGVPTFELTAPKTMTPGLTEFIVEYARSGVAPRVEDYIYRAKDYESGGCINVMPAGLHDVGYSARLNSIDWLRLYSEQDGYIFFEDLKQQWQDIIAPDYVLIDSRTGHSDVEGICTRQLPNAVCFLFFPNEQNLQGLKRVVTGVRQENSSRLPERSKIELHFAVSNVPDLDDEDGIIGKTLARFRAQLEFTRLSGEIHHYDSLSLLNQVVFSEERPNSRLAREYKKLKDEVIRENIADRDVALNFLRQTTTELRSPTLHARRGLIDRVDQILENFPADADIVLQVALVYEAVGRLSDALNLLAVDGKGSAQIYSIRARLNHRLGRLDESAADVKRMLGCDDVQVHVLLNALSFASQVDPTLFELLPQSTAVRSLSSEDKLFVATQIPDGKIELPAKAALLESLLSEGADADTTSHLLAVSLIGLGKFQRAVDILSSHSAGANPPAIADLFNLAMAKLGSTGELDVALFFKVAELDSKSLRRDVDLNYKMCIAITKGVIGQVAEAHALIAECRAMLRMRPRREFSPWTYTKVSSKEILEHLSEIELQVDSGKIRPDFLEFADNAQEVADPERG